MVVVVDNISHFNVTNVVAEFGLRWPPSLPAVGATKLARRPALPLPFLQLPTLSTVEDLNTVYSV